MFAFNFGRKLRRVARRQRRHGKLSNADYRKIIDGSRNPETVKTWKTSIEKGVAGAPWTQKRGDWGDIFSQIWDWLIKNWPAILKIILSLLVFAEPPPRRKSSKLKKNNSETKVIKPSED